MKKSLKTIEGHILQKKFHTPAKSYGTVYGILFGGDIEFKVACFIIAAISFVAAGIMIALDKKLSSPVD